MVIDPSIYQKYSGRSGDPTDAYGKALAGADAQKSKRERDLDRLANGGDISVGAGGMFAPIMRFLITHPKLTAAIGLIIAGGVIVSLNI
ncbi:MAG: hypothetical protein AAGI53_16750 [Planctomycetota bacterium]